MTFEMTELRVPLAFEQLTVSNSAKTLTASVYAPSDGLGPADLAVIYVETNPLRRRQDGIAPTTTVGERNAADSYFTLYGTLCIKKLIMIREGAADSVVNVSYYRTGAQ